MINIAILGYGTVGSGVVEVIANNGAHINRLLQDEINIKYVLDLRDFPEDPIQAKIVHDFDIILHDPEVDIVVEVLGGIEPAYSFVKQSLLAGKTVVTSNKELVADHGSELLQIAKEKAINFLFEASVGGGIPIIRTLNTALSGEIIEEVVGILNGTTNYMLSKMFKEDAEYEEVLKRAQMKGYAEKDPTADVEGFDACRKIAILASLISGQQVDFKDIYTEGISRISKRDMAYAKALNRSIKLLAMSFNDKFSGDQDHLHALVAPHMISHKSPLYGVDGVYNAVVVRGNMLGESMYYGRGAGKLPTASAVVADVIDGAKNKGRHVMVNWSDEVLELRPIAVTIKRYFVRMQGNLVQLKDLLEDQFGSLDFIQLEEYPDEFAFITEAMPEGKYHDLAKKFPDILNMIRLER